jgi:hypothetical protein
MCLNYALHTYWLFKAKLVNYLNFIYIHNDYVLYIGIWMRYKCKEQYKYLTARLVFKGKKLKKK